MIFVARGHVGRPVVYELKPAHEPARSRDSEHEQAWLHFWRTCSYQLPMTLLRRTRGIAQNLSSKMQKVRVDNQSPKAAPKCPLGGFSRQSRRRYRLHYLHSRKCEER